VVAIDGSWRSRSVRRMTTLTPLEILKLVGFATGAVLHLYIAWMIWSRRLGMQQKLTPPERTFMVIGLCLGAWFAGNLLASLHERLLGPESLTGLLRVWNTITTIGVSLVPSALLHAHVAFWSYVDNYRILKPRQVRLAGFVAYAPMIVLPYAIYRVNTGAYKPFFEDLGPLLLPYSVWYLFALWSSALIDWVMRERLDRSAVRERKFFKRLAILLFVTGAFEFIAVGLRRADPDDSLWVAYILLSLLPAFFIAYYVYRHKIVEVFIKGSLVYAAFAVVFIAVYTYGVRWIDRFLYEHGYIKLPGVVEVLLILGMFALAGPVVRLIERAVRRLFTREIGLYRDVVRQVTTGAAGIGELDSLIRYVEETIRRGLDLRSVRIVFFDEAMQTGPERRLAEKMAGRETDVIEADEDLAAIGATAVYALKREGRPTGLMIIAADPRTLTSEKGAVLDVLAGQVAIEIESCRLVEEKVRLERELASRERLATLGQMATTVAHEVKNPLSSIKSIAQVMREEPALQDYDRDLELIISEIDRLNRTVSQLLAFSRPNRADVRPVALQDLMNSMMGLFAGEAKDRGVSLSVEVACDVMLEGAQAAAVREALGNLVLNAMQATDAGGGVAVRADLQSSPVEQPEKLPQLILSITDTGPGISGDEQARIFEPFYTTKSRGTGLGLAIVERRIAELGGSVELTSPVADGHGTQFRLILPLASVAQEEKVTQQG
jgi:signal transduction histidine kinase